MAETAVRYELTADALALIQIDDGKANAFTHSVLESLDAAFARAEQEAAAVVLTGRPGRFSGGFDLEVMRSGPQAANELVARGAELMLRVFEFPKPVVVACSGHAIAMGALLVLACDLRLGARGDFKIGLNEVQIGMTMPGFAAEMARYRLALRHYDRAVGQAEIFAPDAAAEVGFLDRTVEPAELLAVARAEAARLAKLPVRAFTGTKRRSHAQAAGAIRASLGELRPRA
jgi:enoyl-CoA hydratase